MDTGDGYSEVNTIRDRVNEDGYFSKKYILPQNCNKIRFDPVDGNMCFLDNLSIIVPVSNICLDYTTNGKMVDSHSVVFTDTIDPQIEINASGYVEIEISARIFYLA